MSRKERFSIRKLTIGAASILLGTFIYMGVDSTTVQAAEEEPVQEVEQTKAEDQQEPVFEAMSDESNDKVEATDVDTEDEIEESQEEITKTITVHHVESGTGKTIQEDTTVDVVVTRPVYTNKTTGEVTYGMYNFENYTSLTNFSTISTSTGDYYFNNLTGIAFELMNNINMYNQLVYEDDLFYAQSLENQILQVSEIKVEYEPSIPPHSAVKTEYGYERKIYIMDEDGNKMADDISQMIIAYYTYIEYDGYGNLIKDEKTYTDEMFSKIVFPDIEGYITPDTIEASRPDENGNYKREIYAVYKYIRSESTEEKDITRTIHYVDEDGNTLAEDTVQTVTFKRTKYTNETLNEVTYSEWESESDEFSSVTVPTISGYSTTTSIIDSIQVDVDAEDIEETVYYIKDKSADPEEPVEPKTPSDKKDDVKIEKTKMDNKEIQNQQVSTSGVQTGLETFSAMYGMTSLGTLLGAVLLKRKND